jgi:hypothetical protein
VCRCVCAGNKKRQRARNSLRLMKTNHQVKPEVVRRSDQEIIALDVIDALVLSCFPHLILVLHNDDHQLSKLFLDLISQ